MQSKQPGISPNAVSQIFPEKLCSFGLSAVFHLVLTSVLALIPLVSQKDLSAVLLLNVTEAELAPTSEFELLQQIDTQTVQVTPNAYDLLKPEPDDELLAAQLTSEPPEITLANFVNNRTGKKFDFDGYDLATELPVRVSAQTGQVDLILSQAALHDRAVESVSRSLGGYLRTLQQMPGDRLVVVRGGYDQMEEVLAMYEIPFTLVASDDKLNFRACQMVFYNCLVLFRKGRA